MHPFSGFWVSSSPYWSSILVVFLFFSSAPAPLTHQYFQGANLCSLFFSPCPLSLGDVTDAQVTLKFTWHLCELQPCVLDISFRLSQKHTNRNSAPPTCPLFLIPQVGEQHYHSPRFLSHRPESHSSFFSFLQIQSNTEY